MSKNVTTKIEYREGYDPNKPYFGLKGPNGTKEPSGTSTIGGESKGPTESIMPIADNPTTTTPTMQTPTTGTNPYSVAWDANKYTSDIDTSYYQNAIDQYKDMAEKNRQNQLTQAGTQYENSLKEAYINKMQNQKALGEALAQSGIRGGATETSNLKIANMYGNARAAAGTDYSNSVNSINQAIDQNIFDYTSDMNSRAEEYSQNLSQARWQAEREDLANQRNAEREQAENDRAYYTEQYNQLGVAKYADWPKKKLADKIKELNNQLKTLTPGTREYLAVMGEIYGAQQRQAQIQAQEDEIKQTRKVAKINKKYS